MRWAERILMAAACVAVLVPHEHAMARSARHRHRVFRVVPPPPTAPSQDAIELATLAPPSRLSTIEQTYGDAVYARRRLERRIEGDTTTDHEVAASGGAPPYPCDPRFPTTSATVCDGAPHPRSYGQGYAFTPDYLSAPQRLGVPPDTQTPMLPPITGLVWIVDSLRYDPHN